DLFDIAAVAWALRIGDDDPVIGPLLSAGPRQSDLQGHAFVLLISRPNVSSIRQALVARGGYRGARAVTRRQVLEIRRGGGGAGRRAEGQPLAAPRQASPAGDQRRTSG